MVAPRLDAELALPVERPVHDAELDLTLRSLKLVGMASLPLGISLAAILASSVLAWPQFVTTILVLPIVFGVIVFVLAMRGIARARKYLFEQFREWKRWQRVNRTVTREQSRGIVISGDKNKVSIDQRQATATQNNVVVPPLPPAEARRKFFQHLNEFYQHSLVAGTERRNYLKADGAMEDYNFICDGDRLNRAEYDDLIAYMKWADALRGRRRGRTGDLASAPAPALLVDGDTKTIA